MGMLSLEGLPAAGLQNSIVHTQDPHQRIGGDLVFDKLVWLTSREAAAYLRKSTGALRIHVYRGNIEAHKWHRRLYFKKIDLDRMLMDPQKGGS